MRQEETATHKTYRYAHNEILCTYNFSKRKQDFVKKSLGEKELLKTSIPNRSRWHADMVGCELAKSHFGTCSNQLSRESDELFFPFLFSTKNVKLLIKSIRGKAIRAIRTLS